MRSRGADERPTSGPSFEVQGTVPTSSLLGRRISIVDETRRRIADVWYVPRQVDEARLSALWSLLDPAEQAEARRRRFERDRQLQVTAHAAKRVVLAAVAGAHPSQLEFATCEGGKPRLAGRFAGHGFEFSLSHSADLVLFAVARGIEIGVDVERQDTRLRMREMEGSFLTPRERELVSVLTEPERTARLFQVWTRKEAALKAIGSGLAGSVGDLHVGADLRANGKVVRCESSDRPDVVVQDLPCPSGYAASLALRWSVASPSPIGVSCSPAS